MRKTTLFCLLMAFIIKVHAQENRPINTWNIKASYSKVSSPLSATRINTISLEMNYILNSPMEVGLFCSYGTMEWFGYISNIYVNNYSFGINSNFNILPLLVKSDHLKPNIYISGKIGGVITEENSHERIDKFKPLYAIWIGLSYNFNRHFGLFVESGAQYIFDLERNSKFGITYKF